MWHLLLGSLCVLCHQRLSQADSGRQLCRHCLADLPWQPMDALSGPDPIEWRVVPLRYEEPVKSWVLRAKREGGLVEARVLGTLLAETVRIAYWTHSAPNRQPDLMVPVPLSWSRLLRRGHNQATLIAEPVHRLSGVELNRRAVSRIRNTPILPGQTPEARRATVADAFRCKAEVSGKVIAIVDDVVTTGATAAELATCLIQAGARAVHLWCPAGAQGTATLHDPSHSDAASVTEQLGRIRGSFRNPV